MMKLLRIMHNQQGKVRLLLPLLVLATLQLVGAEQPSNKEISSPQIATHVASEDSDAAAADPDENRETDPDRPPIGRSKIDEADYLRLREQHIMRLRGLGNPHRRADPTARSRAIRIMQQQERKLKKSLETVQQAPGLGPLSLSTTTWTELGPSPIPNGQTSPSVPVSGRVTAIAVHPTNSNVAYVGTAQGGLYRTSNGGASWTQLWDNQLSLAIGAIAINPLNPSTVFVGTGESNLALDSFFGVGLYRIDNADTIPVISGPFETRVAGTGTAASNGHAFVGTAISAVAIDPNNANRIFIANTVGGAGINSTGICCGSTNPPSAFIGLYFSSNALAATPVFSRVSGIPGNGIGAATDVLFEPGSSANLLVGVMDFNGGSPDSGIWQTTAAHTASASVSPVFNKVKSLVGQAVDIRLAINKVSSTVTVVAATGESNGAGQPGGRLQKSTDGGLTWPTTLAAANGFCGGQCFYDIAVAIDPTNANNIYIGGAAGSGTSGSVILKKSTNGGTTFTPQTAGLHADTHVIVIAPSNANVVYTGDDGGIFRTTNASAGTITWNSLNTAGFNATQFQSLALHPSDREFMIGGTQDNGTQWKKPDGSWTRADFGDGGFALVDQGAPNTTNVSMYHTYFNQTPNLIGFARITNTANASDGQWDFLGCGGTPNGISCGDDVLFYAPMALGPGSPNTIYFGTDTLYRSVDQGDNMSPVSQAPIDALNPSAAISAIAISRQNDNIRIVGTENGAVFATTTGSNTLDQVTPSHPDWPIGTYVARTAIDPNNSNTAYITIASLGDLPGTHVWKTTNLAGGAGTWVPSGNGIPDIPVNAFVVDPGNPNTLFAGTDIGVFQSTDGGANWSALGLGLPRVAVFDLAIQGQHRVLRAATHGRGIWEIALAPADYSLSIADPTRSAFPGQTATFNGTLTAINGYSNSVAISCQPGATGVPGTCNNTTATPSLSGQAFSVTASSGSVQDFAFNIRGQGSDPAAIIHSQLVTFNVVDVDLSVPNPTSVSVVKGNTSGAIAFQAIALGSYTGTLSLACSGLPAGATCNFFPGSVTPRLGSPSDVSLTVSTSAGMAGFTGTITITGTSSGPSGVRTKTFTLNINSAPSTSDLSVIVSHTFNGKAQFGSAVPFSVLTTNNGPDTANNMHVTIVFAGARVKSVESPPLCTTTGNAISCTIAQLTGGGTNLLQPVFEARAAGAITVSVTVSSDSADASQTDNTDSDSIKIQPRPRSQRGN